MERSRKYLVDGLPVFHIERPGPTTIGLVFRVGQADESLAQRGLTHLIEHLALANVDGLFSFNGQVDSVFTTFVARGVADEVSEFIESVTQALAYLPYDRLAIEAQVLRTEGGSRATTSGEQYVRSLLFGPSGYGLGGYPELAMENLDSDDLRERLEQWRVARFTRDNAAVWITGQLPSSLNLAALPPGTAHRAPAPRPVIDPNAHIVDVPMNTVMLSSVMPRAIAARLLLWVLERRVRDRLRHQDGISYSITTRSENLGAHHTFCALQADCLPEYAEAAIHVVRSELQDLAQNGPSRAELSRYVERSARYFDDPANAAKEVAELAQDHLVGYPHRGPERFVAAASQIEPSQVSGAASQLLRRAFWLVPVEARIHNGDLVPVPASSDWVVSGTQHLEAGAVSPHNAATVVVAPGQIGWSDGRGRVIAIDLDRVEAMHCPSADRRIVWASDGFVLDLAADEWLAGHDIVAHLDNSVADSVIVHPSPQLALAAERAAVAKLH